MYYSFHRLSHNKSWKKEKVLYKLIELYSFIFFFEMMKNTDTTFFTNEEWQFLVDRFKVLLPNNTKFFDVLVWYFRSSWFYELYESLENIEKIRILVWLNVDKPIFDIIEKADKWTKIVKKNYIGTIQTEFEYADDNKYNEQWVKKFIEFIENNKLEIKVYPENIHSKIYIMRKDEKKDPENYGKVITWSSNFSYSWLKSNLEFNVELKDRRDVEFALERFEELWKKWIDVTNEYIDTVKNNTWLNDEITPFDLYLKFLYEYFWDRVNDDKYDIENSDLPDWFIELRYQKDAIKDMLHKLEKYDWVLLADVVWLWKTYISALLWQQLKWWILIICPPHLKEYWEQTFRDFRVSCKVESIWKIDKIVNDRHSQYKYVFIDEAHRFRNDETQSYESISQICRGKKVILVSATPFNNEFNDLYSLITLFQPSQQSTIPNIKNLKVFFDSLKVNSKDKKDNYEEYRNKIQDNSNKIRERILKPLMIRRTRKEIAKYFNDDIDIQWLIFPKVEEPKRIMYQFNEKLESLFEWTIDSLKKISYARYSPSNYIKPWIKISQVEKVWQANLKWFMKTLIIKRLESSFFAFRNSIRRVIQSYEIFIEMYNKWDIYISKKINIYDLMENDFDKLVDLVEEWEVLEYKKEYFRNDNEMNFEKDLYKDLDILRSMYEKRDKIDYDPKFDKLESLLQSDIKNKQVIIFSESKETVKYLGEKLEKSHSGKVISYSSESSSWDKDIIKRNFDPTNNNPENKYNILITTDVLAEWVNLHRSNKLINYDIPWNPTRVIQRIWRINRVWTTHNSIFIYNFFPTIQSNNAIKLEENVKSKMDVFIKLLWNDSKHLTECEDIEWHTLFDKLNSIEFLNNEEWEEIEKSELKYLKLIRQIRDTDVELFQKIKKNAKKIKKW